MKKTNSMRTSGGKPRVFAAGSAESVLCASVRRFLLAEIMHGCRKVFRLRFRSIRFQILAIVLVCYLVPTLVLGQYMGSVFFDDLRQKTEAALTSGAEHARTLTLQQIERAITLSKDATYDGELNELYSAAESGTLSHSECFRLARSYLERKYGREPLFTFAACFVNDKPDQLIYSRSGYREAQDYLTNVHQRVKRLGDTLDTRCLFLQEGEDLYLVRNLYNMQLERYGMLVLGVARELLTGEILRLGEMWDAQIDLRIGDSGDLLLDWAGMQEGLTAAPGSGEIAYTRRTYAQDYSLLMRMTVAEQRVYGEIHAFRRMIAGLLCLLIVVVCLILWYANRRLVKPIGILSRAAQRIEAGELGVTVPMRGHDELGDLGRTFSSMSIRLADLIEKTYKEEIALRDARIQAMQSRLNPHFINNALETINWQARIEGCDTVSAMVEALSVLLNASMARGDRRMVPLREEGEVARAYLYFVGLRFGERLTTKMEIAPEAMEVPLPLLTLPPLLENAVEHGIAPAGGGRIILRAGCVEEELLLEVRNTGRSMTRRDEERIDRALHGDTEKGQHLGLANIASRIRLIYGGAAQLSIRAEGEGETVVRLRLPRTAPFQQADTTNPLTRQ